jgi:hypothetical protein
MDNPLTTVVTQTGLTRDSRVWLWSRITAIAAIVASGAVDVVGLSDWLGIHLTATAAHWVTAVAVIVLWVGGKYDSSPLPGSSKEE